MIKIVLGNIGSGKTASVVRDIITDKNKRITYSNIITKGTKNNIPITTDMLVIKEVIGHKKSGEEVVKYHLNKEFWENAKRKHGAINVVIDEAHSVLNSRSSMSKQNKIMTDFLALLRRILGSNDAGGGELILITQLDRRLDVVAREMATQVKFHVCHYVKRCKKCGFYWDETNETPNQVYECSKCGSCAIAKQNHIIEVFVFANMKDYIGWREFGQRTYFKHYMINDIEKYFKYYDTFQWENLLSDL